jgi:hypothetical protein
MVAVRRMADGRVRVRLTSTEREVLRSLPEQLRGVITGEDDAGGIAGRVRARLFPAGYDDAEAEAEYRELADATLVEERLDALATFERTLAAGRAVRRAWSTDLSPDEAHAWLSVVHDFRLAVAEAVGIQTEEDWENGPDTDDPGRMLLWYLAALEEGFVAALSGLLGSADRQQ